MARRPIGPKPRDHSMNSPWRWRGALALAAIMLTAGLGLDLTYKSSTPDPVFVQGTVVDFVRPHRRQVYPVFEFQDADGGRHRVMSPSQQGVERFAAGDVIPVAYSRANPEKARIDTFWFDHRWLISALVVSLTVLAVTSLRPKLTGR